MNEQEVERQLAIWREEMRQERKRRLAAASTSASRSPRRAAPERPQTERAADQKASRLALYKSELDETTAKVATAKLSRYSRLHVDPRDVDFFEARSVLRDYIRGSVGASMPKKVLEADSGKSHARPASRPPSRRQSPQPSTIPLNRSAVLRQQAAKQSMEAYEKAHLHESRNDPRRAGETVAFSNRAPARSVSPSSRTSGAPPQSADPVSAAFKTDNRWRRPASPTWRSFPDDTWTSSRRETALELSHVDRISPRRPRGSWGLSIQNEPPVSRFQPRVYTPRPTNPAEADDSARTAGGVFTSGLQLRYGHSPAVPNTRPLSGQPIAAFATPVRGRDRSSPPRWSRSLAEEKDVQISTSSQWTDATGRTDRVNIPSTLRAPFVNMGAFKRSDLFQGHTAV